MEREKKRRKLVEASLVGKLGRKEGERKKERKNWKTFCKPLVKQLVEDTGGLNEAIYESEWVHLIRNKMGECFSLFRRPFGHLEMYGENL